MNLAAPWSWICPVNVQPLAAWLASAQPRWPAPSAPSKPQRIHGGELPMAIIQPIIANVLACFDFPAVAHEPMLSRMLPGQSHGMHVDTLRSDCVTRVHVPVLSDGGAWMWFEEEPGPVGFEVGTAYTFDARRRHAFGNDTEAEDGERVHLIFDVLRAAWYGNASCVPTTGSCNSNAMPMGDG